MPCPGMLAAPRAARSAGASGSSLRRSRGTWAVGAPIEDGLQPLGHVGVVVEAEHGVGLRQRLGQLVAVALGQAADRHHRLRPPVDLEVRRRQQGVELSFFAASTNPQVFTITASAADGSSTSWKPPSSSRAASSSESTSLRAQPSETR